MSAAEELAAEYRRDLAEGTAILKQVLALVNRKRRRAGLKGLRVVEDDRRSVA